MYRKEREKRKRGDSYSVFRVVTRERSIVVAINKPSKAGNAAYGTNRKPAMPLSAHAHVRARTHVCLHTGGHKLRDAVSSRSIMNRVSFSVLLAAIPIYLAAIFNSSVSRGAIGSGRSVKLRTKRGDRSDAWLHSSTFHFTHCKTSP